MLKGAKPIVFLKEVKTELGKVRWPTRKETARLTLIVLGASAVVGIFISSLDFVFTKLLTIAVQR
jgi:preprotein translocase subunit SecE